MCCNCRETGPAVELASGRYRETEVTITVACLYDSTPHGKSFDD